MSSIGPTSASGVDERSSSTAAAAVDGTLQTVEIIKQPGQTLGFYIREGNGIDRWTGVFISRIAPGSVVAANGVLHVGDEILAVNGVDVTRTRLDDVVVLMSIPKRLVLDIRVPRPACGDVNCSNAACSVAVRSSASGCGAGGSGYDDGAPPSQPIVVLKSGFAAAGNGGMGYNGGMDDRSPDEPIAGSSYYPQQASTSTLGSRSGTLSKRYDGRSQMTPTSMTSTGLIYPTDVTDSGYQQQQHQQQHHIDYDRSRYSGGSFNYSGGNGTDSYGISTIKSGPPTFSRSYSTGGSRSALTGYGGQVPAHDYASDTDVGGYSRSNGGGSNGRTSMGRQLARPYGAVSGSTSGSPAMRGVPSAGPDRVYYNGFDDTPPPPPSSSLAQTTSSARTGLTNGGGGGRSSSFDQYNSDSEVVLGTSGGGWYPGYHRSSAAMRAMSGSVVSASGVRCATVDGSGAASQGTGFGPPVGGGADDRSYSMPHVYHGYCSSGDECDSTWNGGKFESMSIQQTIPGNGGAMNGALHRTRSNTTGSSHDMHGYLTDTSPVSSRTSTLDHQRRGAGDPTLGGSYLGMAYDDYEYRLNRAVSPAAPPTTTTTAACKVGPPTAPKPAVSNHARLTRKMSTDSLLAYRTYQQDDRPSAAELLGIRVGANSASGSRTSGALQRSGGGSGSGGGGSSTSSGKGSSTFAYTNNNGGTAYSTMTLSRAQHLAGRASSVGPAIGGRSTVTSSSATPSPYYSTGGTTPLSSTATSAGSSTSAATKLQRNLQLARKPLQIQTETFRQCRSVGLNGTASSDSYSASGPALDGLLGVHVFCAHGLRSSTSRTTLRDLYCVVELDAVSRARTTVRTGAINFDWDESFEVDTAVGARRLSFLVYSWDPNVRHRLCFGGSIALPSALQSDTNQAVVPPGPSIHRLAVSLEPKGVLYVELEHRDMITALRRTPSSASLSRNRPGGQSTSLANPVFGVALGELVGRERLSISVPAVMQRCIDEVERRGMDHVGIYRLCGSSKRKQQLREELERNPMGTDLSADAISDINVITSVLKDFLRELPEPLCSNALYQMLMDALNVQISGDADGNARLMLGILDCLPPANQETLTYLLDHLKRIAVRADINKMTTLNLAISFGPWIVCPSSASGVGSVSTSGATSGPSSMAGASTIGDAQQSSSSSSSSSSAHNAAKYERQIELVKYLLDIWPETRDMAATVERLRTGNTGSSSLSTMNHRFETMEYRPDSGSFGASDAGVVSSRAARADLDRAQQQLQQQLEDVLAWENSRTSPC